MHIISGFGFRFTIATHPVSFYSFDWFFVSIFNNELSQLTYKNISLNDKKKVACFATAEFISLYERKHKEAAELYRNVCFRPPEDKSPNGFLIDGTKAYPAGCYNLAKMLMTGKGGIPSDNLEAYHLLDRACRGDHGGACYLQAQILCSEKDSFAKGIPHDPKKATELYQKNCDDGDTIRYVTTVRRRINDDGKDCCSF